MKYLVIFLLFLTSCSPQKRLARILKKNPELETVHVKIDTFKQIINGVDTTYFLRVDTLRIIKAPPTRYEVRKERKIEKEKVKQENKTERVRERAEKSKIKQENKTERREGK